MRSLATSAALACVVALGAALSPPGTWANPAPAPMGEPAQPAPMGEPVAYATDTSGAWLLIVDRLGEPGESDVADYGLSLADCIDAMNAQPRALHAACEKDRA